MRNIVAAWLLLAALLRADTYVVVDISQGISKAVYNELGLLTFPEMKSEENIYREGEKVHLYAFSETRALAKSFVYHDRNRHEAAYKKGKKVFLSFFSQVRKHGVKKRKQLGMNVIFVIDTSGSMKQNGVMDEVKQTVAYLIRAKSKKAKIAIVTFDGKKGMKPAKRARVVADFTRDKRKLLAAVDAIEPSRYDTFLGEGLDRAQALLDRIGTRRTVVMLFTDGKAVDDAEKAHRIVERFKREGVRLKVVAVGGADAQMLQSFSTTGYVFNATSEDLRAMRYAMQVGSDPLFLRLNDFLDNAPPIKAGDRLIVYSRMMNVDAQSDFYIVPNTASERFYEEMKRTNEKRGSTITLNGAAVYVRVLGRIDASRLNDLKLFYRRYFGDAGGSLRYFSTAPLSKERL